MSIGIFGELDSFPAQFFEKRFLPNVQGVSFRFFGYKCSSRFALGQGYNTLLSPLFGLRDRSCTLVSENKIGNPSEMSP